MINWAEMGKAIGSMHHKALARKANSVVRHTLDEDLVHYKKLRMEEENKKEKEEEKNEKKKGEKKKRREKGREEYNQKTGEEKRIGGGT